MKTKRTVSLVRTFSMIVCAALLVGVLFSTQVCAREYDPQEAGHPLHIAAYLVSPLGVLLDYGLMRPAFWLVQREPFKTIFGYTDDPIQQMG